MAKQSITLGIAISLSGRYALLGRQALEGLECYVRDVNAAGGILLKSEGKKLPVSLVVEDDESDESKIRNLVEKLIRQNQIDLLIGPYGSGLTLAAAEMADASLAALREARRLGMAMAAMMPMIATTIKSSIREKPFWPLFCCISS